MPESVGYMSLVPGSSFTVGDLVEFEVNLDGNGFQKEKGRVILDWQGNWLIAIIETNDEGKEDSVTAVYIKQGNEPFVKNVKCIEPGPWHALCCKE